MSWKRATKKEEEEKRSRGIRRDLTKRKNGPKIATTKKQYAPGMQKGMWALLG